MIMRARVPASRAPASLRYRSRNITAASLASVFRSGGRPIESQVRRDMERSFGADFSSVRIHDDDRATESAAAIGALAYTSGAHIAVRRDLESLKTSRGRAVLAHELAHVARERASEPMEPSLRIGAADDREEQFAAVAAARVTNGAPASISATGLAAESGVLRRQLDPDRRVGVQEAPAQPMQGGSWTDDAVSINLTPTPSGGDRDQARRDGREPVWCQFGGYDREECKPLQSCRTTGESTFMIDAVYRVDGPAPAPEYPPEYHSQPITVGGDFVFQPSSGGERSVSSFSRTVRYAGRGNAIHVHRFQFSTREDGVLSVSLQVGTPSQVVIYNGSAECTRVDCV